jgi:hypothetical protein
MIAFRCWPDLRAISRSPIDTHHDLPQAWTCPSEELNFPIAFEHARVEDLPSPTQVSTKHARVRCLATRDAPSPTPFSTEHAGGHSFLTVC